MPVEYILRFDIAPDNEAIFSIFKKNGHQDEHIVTKEGDIAEYEYSMFRSWILNLSKENSMEKIIYELYQQNKEQDLFGKILDDWD